MPEVRVLIRCGVCGKEIIGTPVTDPRGRMNEKDRIEDALALLGSEHRGTDGHYPGEDFRLVEVLETEAEKAFIPSGSLPQWKKKSRSSPSDGSGTHQGPTRGQKPRLVVVGSAEDEEEQRRREQASVRDPSPHHRATRAK